MFSCKIIIQLPKRPWRLPRLKAKRSLLTALFLILGSLLILCGLFFSLRNTILQNLVAQKLQAYLLRHPGVTAQIGSARFSGLSQVTIGQLHLFSKSENLDLKLESCQIDFALGDLLLGRVLPQNLILNDLQIKLQRLESVNPASSTPDNHSESTVKPEMPPDYAERLAYLLELFFRRFPGKVAINSLGIDTEIDGIRQSYQIPQLIIKAADFEARFQIENQEQKWFWKLSGSIDRKNKRLALRWSPSRPGEKITLPFIDRQWGFQVGFDSVALSLKSDGLSDGILRLNGSLSISGLTLRHPRISVDEVVLENAALDYSMNIGSDFFEIDKPTQASINSLSISPYIKFKSTPSPQLTLRIDPCTIRAEDFFGALPTGLFTHLAGIQVSGELACHLNFFVDFDRPEELILEPSFEKKEFRIQRFGQVDFRAVTGPFVHTVYEKDMALRTIWVSSDNPDFHTLDRISPYLQQAVLISEDGAFYRHRGFLLEPFKDSIVANIKEKRFVRGGSTISMQLVKNLYLKRNKTIARKLEEMIITWLIEHNRLISKERMFEIYLNIIEWGPGVYGAQEAARFYFAKDAADLTLSEAIFMASIIPRPKRFMISFDGGQLLKPWVQDYYRDVSTKLLRRELISQADFDHVSTLLRLKGPARLLLKGSPDIPYDSLPDEVEDGP